MKLRADALCRRAMMHYMSFKFPDNFARVWSGVPKDMVKRQEFVWFFQGLYISRLEHICKLNKVEFDDFAKYEVALLETERRESRSWERPSGLHKILQQHRALNSRMSTAYEHVMDESKFVRPTGR